MKFRQRLPVLKFLKNKKGQSLVEFVLLLAVISGLSYGFVSLVNKNIGKYWEHCVNTIVNDSGSKKTLSIE